MTHLRDSSIRMVSRVDVNLVRHFEQQNLDSYLQQNLRVLPSDEREPPLQKVPNLDRHGLVFDGQTQGTCLTIYIYIHHQPQPRIQRPITATQNNISNKKNASFPPTSISYQSANNAEIFYTLEKKFTPAPCCHPPPPQTFSRGLLSFPLP